MDEYIGQNIAALFLVAAVLSLSYKLTVIGGPSKHRFKSYVACLCVTYALGVALAEINGSPAEAGGQGYERGGQAAGRDARARSGEEKYDYTRKVFYVSIAPALIGVYCGRRSARRRKMSAASPRRDPPGAHYMSPAINAYLTVPRTADANIPAQTDERCEPGRW
jgi:hypothetical protein